MKQNQQDHNELLNLYASGVAFLERHPNVKEFHQHFRSLAVSVATKINPVILKKWQEKEIGKDSIRDRIASFYLLAGIGLFFCFFSLVGGLFTGQIFQPILLCLILSIVYGCITVYSAANPILDFKENYFDTEPVKNAPQVETFVTVPSKKSEKKSAVRQNKNIFLKIYNWCNSLLFFGWIYLVVYYPDIIYRTCADWGVLQFVPSDVQTGFQKIIEAGREDTEKLFIFGFISGLFINFVLSTIGSILAFLCSFLGGLSSKKDIREI